MVTSLTSTLYFNHWAYLSAVSFCGVKYGTRLVSEKSSGMVEMSRRLLSPVVAL